MITAGVAGCELITALEDAIDVHPAALVTVKLYVPSERPEIVLPAPVPVVVTASG
jgi:hypothetical protein